MTDLGHGRGDGSGAIRGQPTELDAQLQRAIAHAPRDGRVAALVALVAAGARQRLLRVSQVITPKAQGTPVSSWTRWIPRAASAQT